MEETVEACYVEHIAQKARKVVEAKIREEAEKRRLVEEKKKKKRLEYLQQLQDKVLVKDATLLESAEGSQIVGSKHKKITLGDKER